MTTFDQREKAFEDKFAHDEELEFRARARRNRLVANWAAEKLGFKAEETNAYVDRLVAADLAEHGDAPVVRRLRADFDAKGLDISDHVIERTLNELLTEARRQITTQA